ncbi:hypothetical protein FNV43_RR20843 [Rhamnella rubrinervis]|uniref:Uncharacterized protein n=1 Tax=Rhamnella rubrinervis TaxID=2594499 RepID=A0A8K0GQV2_9ROSA|nr:hypothetical protein FNV43_RR20843 [Rhamnella rubrinervis]
MQKLANEVLENWVCESCPPPKSSGEEDTLLSPYNEVLHDATYLSGSSKFHDDSGIALPMIAHEPTMGVKHRADHRLVTLIQKSTIATSSSLKVKEKLEIVEEKNSLSLQKKDNQGSETTSRGENQTVVQKITVSDRAPTTMSTSLKRCKLKSFGVTKYRPADSNLRVYLFFISITSFTSPMKTSLGSKLPLIPEVLPKSMLCDQSLTEIDLTEAINGWDASKFESSKAGAKSKKRKIQAKAKDKETFIGCDIEMDSSPAKAKEKETIIGCDIEIPPWLFPVPGLKGGAELIRIPRDSERPYLPLPQNVHASVERVSPPYFAKLAGVPAQLWT